jgi:hypothetical protein
MHLVLELKEGHKSLIWSSSPPPRFMMHVD